MLNIGPQEVLLILIVALVVVGPQRLPELARSLARGLREFRKAQDEVRRTVADVLEEPKKAVRSVTAATASPSAPGAGGTTASTEAGSATDGAASAVAEVASALRPLAETARELRKTREEIQRSFRVDLAGAPAVRPTAPVAGVPAERAAGDAPSEDAAEGATEVS